MAKKEKKSTDKILWGASEHTGDNSTGNWSCRSGAQERQPRLQLGFISHRKGHRLGYLEKRETEKQSLGVTEAKRQAEDRKWCEGNKNWTVKNKKQLEGKHSTDARKEECLWGKKSMHSFYFTCQELLQDAHSHLECPSQLVIFTCLCPSVLRCVLNKYIFL